MALEHLARRRLVVDDLLTLVLAPAEAFAKLGLSFAATLVSGADAPVYYGAGERDLPSLFRALDEADAPRQRLQHAGRRYEQDRSLQELTLVHRDPSGKCA